MNKQEFLDRLRTALTGEVSQPLISENVRYYDDYIMTEVRKGRSEDEVLIELGDPRLIAHTIIDMNQPQVAEKHIFRDAQEEQPHEKNKGWSHWETHLPRILKVPGWVWLLVVVLILVALFQLAFSLFVALLPILLPVVIIVGIVKLFRNWLK